MAQGKKAWYKKWWVWVIVVVVIIGFSSTEEEAPQSSGGSLDTSEQTKSEQADTKPVDKEMFEVGEDVTLGDYGLIVTDVSKSAGSEWDKPKSGCEFVTVSVTIKNVGDSEISYNPFDFSMQNSNGQITDQAFTTIDSDTALSSGNLASGGQVSGTITFEQPIDDTGLVLKYQPNMFSDKVIKVKIN